MGILILFATGAFFVVLSLVVTFLALPTSADCPECGAETVPLQTGWGRIGRRLLIRRWCMHCRWEGHARPERISATERAIEILRSHRPQKKPEAPRER
jgi:hypothetical protein